MTNGRDRTPGDLIEQVTAAELSAPELVPGQHHFVADYYRDVATDDLVGRSVADLGAVVRGHLHLATTRMPGALGLRIFTPTFAEDGWSSPHTVVEIVTDDMAFLVDTVVMEINRHDIPIHLIVHPIARVARDAQGVLTDVAAGEDGRDESFMHVEIDRQTDPEALATLERGLRRVLSDLRHATEDWQPMIGRARAIAHGLLDEPMPPESHDEAVEAAAFLNWMAEEFTFLGYREYDLVDRDGDDVLVAVPGSGLGILRQASSSPTDIAALPPQARARARDPHVLTITKANSKATVHRPSHLDYIALKKFDADGQVIGERRFLGLYPWSAYSTPAEDLPVVRRKVAEVWERAAFDQASHSGRELAEILESYPRDELFQISAADLYRIALGILHLQDRRTVRVFLRRDDFARFYSCLVFLPRDRYTTDVRVRIQQILAEGLGGTSRDFGVHLTDHVLARLNFTIATDPWADTDVNVDALEAQIAAAIRTWSDDLRVALVDEVGEARAVPLLSRWAQSFPAAYRADFPARAAVADVLRLDELDPAGDMGVWLYRPVGLAADSMRLRLFRTGEALPLSAVLPLLASLGVEVLDASPYQVSDAAGREAHVYDFGLRFPGEQVAVDAVRGVFEDAFLRAFSGDTESDAFDRLVLLAGLDWEQVRLMRAYARYLRQVSSRYSEQYIADTLAEHVELTRLLVNLFTIRLAPSFTGNRDEEAAEIVTEILAGLDLVASLDEDRIIRAYLALVDATVRTNFYQRTDALGAKPYLSLKVDSARVPDMPRPFPLYEIYVHSPRMEGVHLRAGHVARGGIRFSDRREDFRTEILGLMKAQDVKNSVIVPVGAKGGFVVKRPASSLDRDAYGQEVVACYSTLIRGMLDITDNLVGGQVVPPAQVVRRDGDDPYLVVAADKGTATFSDIANALSADYGFWLGDAFASGGSIGYDHKKMGITARGAWESVKRHFRHLGVNVQTTDFTVVGIGDMSGDVFGNGMLLSEHIRLVAAFDHRHVFIDPNPDPAASIAERRRLFDLPRSSWADYDTALISAGGGVFPRTAKTVVLTDEMRAALGTDATELTPTELIRVVLRAPVDLLWNGGIGTYVKASTESHADVGDKASESVRIDATELRARVVGEGGNLGFTQLGRIEFARRGGRINTDAIDNSAGVDCSDHEVNIKILVDRIVADGELSPVQRERLLAEMTDSVGDLVLEDNVAQTRALAVLSSIAPATATLHDRMMTSLESAGHLDRSLEFLPSSDEITARIAAGTGLTSPELAVLLAYAKNTLVDEVVGSDLPDDPYLAQTLIDYFPQRLREQYRDVMPGHRLARQIIATGVVNEMVNLGGITIAFKLAEHTAAPAADIVRAFVAARDVFSLRELVGDIEALDNVISADVQTEMLAVARLLVERAARWFLRSRPHIDIAAEVALFNGDVDHIAEVDGLLRGAERAAYDRTRQRLVDAGVGEELADWVAGLESDFASLDIIDAARRRDRDPVHVARVYFALSDRLGLDWLQLRIARLPDQDRWQSLARNALRDDLYAARIALTDLVLGSEDDDDIDGAVERWIVSRGAAVTRAAQVLSDVREADGQDVTALSVALREVRSLVTSAS